MTIPTIKEIARLSGVSVSTVSRVINKMPDVNEATRKKVLAVIEENGYIPNANAKNLKQIQTKMVCIVAKGAENLFFAPILEKIQSEIEKKGYNSFIHYIDEREEEVSAAKRLVIEKKAEGIIFLGGSAENKENELSQIPVPCVFVTISAQNLKLPNVYSVYANDKKSAQTAVNYLFECGHKDIAVLGGKLGQRDLIYYRYEGVKESFAEHNLIFDPQNYIESKFSLVNAYEAVSANLSKKGKWVTAIFAMSDIMAIGAIKAILDFDYRVPEDISVIGYDGLQMSEFYNPSITTIRQPSMTMAIESVRLAVGAIEKKQKSCHIMLDTKLIIGKSVAKLK